MTFSNYLQLVTEYSMYQNFEDQLLHTSSNV